MGWVLMVILWSGPYERPVLTMQDFGNEASCQAARQWVVDTSKRYTVNAVCVVQR